MSKTYATIGAAREALKAAGYAWKGFSGFTGRETYKAATGEVAIIKKLRRGVALV